jgi:hypothetical protein
MQWTAKECQRLKVLAKRKISFEAISLRLGRSEAAVVSKARREGIKLNMAVALPRLGAGGWLEALGGLPIPSHPRWPPKESKGRNKRR